MIIAMPMSRGRLAAHFTKAQRIGFFNEYHQLITSFDNPAIGGGGCYLYCLCSTRRWRT